MKTKNQKAGAKKATMKTTIFKEPFWTCFAGEGLNHVQAHVTHKYLGELSLTQLRLVRETIDKYFQTKPFEKFDLDFYIEDRFGPCGDIKVFKPDSYVIQNSFNWLRRSLDRFRDDDYYPYLPHVTSNQPVQFRFDRYLLCTGDTIIQEWRSNDAAPVHR